MLLFLSAPFYFLVNKKNPKNIKQHNFFFNIDPAKKCFLSIIRMISEGSCDTEDWNNYAENSALPSRE